MRAEPLSSPHAYHAEGPIWWEPWGGLRYVDMLAGDILLLGDDGTVTRTHVGSVAAAMRPRSGGGAVVAGERGFLLGHANDLSDLTPARELWTGNEIRFNEGGCDPSGAFYCGTMAYAVTPGAASMWRLDPDGSTSEILTDLTISNGLGWSPDGTLAYYIDTPTRTISAFDWSPEAGLTNRRPFVELDASVTGGPDGLTVDAEGGVWVALFGGAGVRRYSPEGSLEAIITVEPSQVTACTFGGPDLDTLYITTSRENLGDDEEPLAGAVFACQPGVRGLPALPYSG
ncbi:SMP-30/gluconolactonase/LRE family protein [Demetria terragena]|uniref:SMP-30/gluconolactonase/LRE family protein n=1 Tax=Demetria terragena TaxID=63959 RepID=UPI000381D1FD|nr:SMP-30/gluconolactonase/LRE family protein [Demetria terragena]